jgi:tetratricopeptide (TPR) repeat protein
MSRRWLLPAVLLVLLFAASLVHVQPGTLGVLRGAAEGKSFLLDPGLHLRIPFFQRLLLFPAGPFHLDFEQEATSREGSRVRLTVHFEGLILRDQLLEFAQRAGSRNGPTVVQDDLGDFLVRWAGDRSASDISASPEELKERFRGAARSGGFEIKSLTVRRAPDAPGAGLPAAPRHGVKVVLVGLDAADWQLIDPLAAAGALPNLARLKKEGAWANLRSMDPMLSPLLWTTVATGKPPEEHGVVDFLVPDPGTGRKSPVTSAARKVKALWTVFSQAGRSCAVVAWWATWPAEKVNGTLVSDRVAYSLFDAAGGAGLERAVYPDSYAATVGRLQITADRIRLEDLRPFADITQADLDAARRRASANPAGASRDPLIHLTRILSAARTYHALALDLLSRGQPDLFAVYYQGIDEVSHRFAHFAEPRMQMVSEADYRRYRRAVEAIYREQDRMLGELLARVDPSSLVLVVSDHGFRNGSGRPKDQPPDIEGQPARWHRPYGIFLASGPMVAPGEKDPLSLLDIAPMVLEAGGLPAAKDMPGSIPPGVFTASFLASRPEEEVATYETGGSGAGEPVSPEAGAEARRAQAALEENLRSLGYIGGSSAGGDKSAKDGTETAFSHASLAGIHLAKGKLEEAEKEAKRALQIAPGYLPALVYLAEVYEQERRYAEALPLARQAAATDSPDRQTGIYLLMANLYVSLGRPKEGLADLASFQAAHGKESDLHSALGIVKGAAGDSAGAEAEYRRALTLDPLAQEPVKRLVELWESGGNLGALEPILRSALQSNGDSAFHHNFLGLVEDRAGRAQEAEAEYRRALGSDPEHVGALVNLGGLLARQKRLDEAAPLLKRALARDPRSVEARVSLGAVLGIQGKTGEAIRTLEEGRSLGMNSPSLCNALAMAYYQNRERQKAVATLKESLQLDPRQSSARAMLEEWEKR